MTLTPDPNEILASSTSLLKHDPSTARLIGRFAALSAKEPQQLKAVHRIIKKVSPPRNAILVDPLETLQLAIGKIFVAPGSSVTLADVADPTNQFHPMTRVSGALRRIGHAIGNRACIDSKAILEELDQLFEVEASLSLHDLRRPVAAACLSLCRSCLAEVMPLLQETPPNCMLELLPLPGKPRRFSTRFVPRAEASEEKANDAQ